MTSIKLHSYVGNDGILHLNIPVVLSDTNLKVTLTVEPISSVSQGKGYPVGFFDKTYGICKDDPIILDEDGIFEDLDDSL